MVDGCCLLLVACVARVRAKRRGILASFSKDFATNAVQVLLKADAIPVCVGQLALDSMVVVESMDVRPTWRRQDGSIPEGHVVSDVGSI